MTPTQFSSLSTDSVWKILLAEEAAELLASGSFSGSADDRRDGFIHLSSPEQVAGTLAKHFAGRTGLVAACCDPLLLGAALRWETSRGGALFPHLYRPLTVGDVSALVPCAEERLAQLGIPAGGP